MVLQYKGIWFVDVSVGRKSYVTERLYFNNMLNSSGFPFFSSYHCCLSKFKTISAEKITNGVGKTSWKGHVQFY